MCSRRSQLHSPKHSGLSTRRAVWRCRRVWRRVASAPSRGIDRSVHALLDISQTRMIGVLLCSSATKRLDHRPRMGFRERGQLIRPRPSTSSSWHLFPRTRPRSTVVRPDLVAVGRDSHAAPLWSLKDSPFLLLLLLCTPPSRCAIRYVLLFFLVAAIAAAWPPSHHPLALPLFPRARSSFPTPAI